MNEDSVRELFNQKFGVSPDSVFEYQDGVNTVYNVSVDGRAVVVKFGTFDPSSVRVEPYVLRWLSDRGLPTPEVHKIGTYERVPFFVMNELEGNQHEYPPELPTNELVSLSRTLGSLLSQAHGRELGVGRLSVRDDQLVTNSEEWETFFRSYLDRFISQAKQNYPYLGSEAARLSHWATIPEEDGGFFCPLDMHTRNVFVGNDGEVTGVMDFERCYGGHSAWGYATTLHTLQAGRSPDVVEDVEIAFESGYERNRNVPQVAPVFELAALLREMRAAHMWWDDLDAHQNRLQSGLDSIEDRIEKQKS